MVHCVQYARIAEEIMTVPGVVTHGLMLQLADVAVIAHPQKEQQLVRFERQHQSAEPSLKGS